MMRMLRREDFGILSEAGTGSYYERANMRVYFIHWINGKPFTRVK